MVSVLASFSAALVKYTKESNLEKEEGVFFVFWGFFLPTILHSGEIEAAAT